MRESESWMPLTVWLPEIKITIHSSDMMNNPSTQKIYWHTFEEEKNQKYTHIHTQPKTERHRNTHGYKCEYLLKSKNKKKEILNT